MNQRNRSTTPSTTPSAAVLPNMTPFTNVWGRMRGSSRRYKRGAYYVARGLAPEPCIPYACPYSLPATRLPRRASQESCLNPALQHLPIAAPGGDPVRRLPGGHLQYTGARGGESRATPGTRARVESAPGGTEHRGPAHPLPVRAPP